jgi:hypothetical protein
MNIQESGCAYEKPTDRSAEQSSNDPLCDGRVWSGSGKDERRGGTRSRLYLRPSGCYTSVASLLLMCAGFCGLLLSASMCPAQEVKLPSDEHAYSFGVTVVSSSWLKGDIYLLKPETSSLPNFKKLESIGSLYTPVLNLPSRNFHEGFPGITDRFEWFAIDYHGRFWVSKPGKYRFALQSDDGARLFIDSKTVINNDGTHAPITLTGAVNLTEGIHTIRVSYFQGPREHIALVLAISEPGQEKFFIFNIERYQPPADKYNDSSIDQTTDVNSRKKSIEPSK